MENDACIIKDGDGFKCKNTGRTFSKFAIQPIHCNCKSAAISLPKAIPTTNEALLKNKSEQIISDLEQALNGRTLDEALLYLDICKGCPKFRVDFCARDRGCDKKQVFIARLARGYCKERWGESAKNSTAYKFILTSELVQKRGPGQDHSTATRPPTAAQKKAPHGPGTELKAIIRVCQRILPWFDLSPRQGCGCQATARWMNQLGPDGCEAKMDLILKRLEDEAKARKLTIPFRRFAAERLVRYAIGRARKKEARNG